MLKADQEEAIEFVIKELVEARLQKHVGNASGERQSKRQLSGECQTLVESSPVKNSEDDGGSNGIVEHAVQDVEGAIRGLLLALEAHLGMVIDSRERIIAFIPEYAA